MPRCGGCEGVCRCSVVAADESISVAGSGQSLVPYEIGARLSADVGNAIEVRADGLYSGAEVVAGLTVGAGLDGDGTGGDPLLLKPPSAVAYGFAPNAISVPHNASTAVVFQSEAHDNAAMIDLATQPTRITVPVTGVYLVEGFLQWASFTYTIGSVDLQREQRFASLAINGSTSIAPFGGRDVRPIVKAYDEPGSGTGIAPSLSQQVTRMLALTAGTYLTLLAFQVNPGSLNRDLERWTLGATFLGKHTP